MKHKANEDPFLERAIESAEESELQEGLGDVRALEVELEAAQGVEVFENPDDIMPATALREGSPGHETLTGDDLELDRNGEDERLADRDDY